MFATCSALVPFNLRLKTSSCAECVTVSVPLVLCEKWQSGEEAATSSLLVPTGPQFHAVRQQNRHHSADHTAPQVHGMIPHPSLHFFLHQKRHDHHVTCTSLEHDCGFSSKETSGTHCRTVEEITASARVSRTVLHRQWFTLNTVRGRAMFH